MESCLVVLMVLPTVVRSRTVTLSWCNIQMLPYLLYLLTAFCYLDKVVELLIKLKVVKTQPSASHLHSGLDIISLPCDVATRDWLIY